MKIAPIVNSGGKKIGWQFFCPGCNNGHAIQTANEKGVYGGTGDVWTFNGNQEKPTIRASVKVTGGHPDQRSICHSFVTDGEIQFLSDCTHSLKGKTVSLPEV